MIASKSASRLLQTTARNGFDVGRKLSPSLNSVVRGTHTWKQPTNRFASFPLFPLLLTKRPLSTSASAFNATTTTGANGSSRKQLYLGIAGGILLAGLHSATGSQNDFYDYRFVTNKSPDDLASFYGGEEFMELFSVFPLIGHIMMRTGEFDENGNFFVTGLPGTLKVQMVFSDDTSEETGDIEWFNKRERFRDMAFGYTCWDMVTNFGFRTLEDGTIEVYHYGEYFHGNLPIVSQLALLVFKVHARWLAWATEHHINHFAFTSETEEEEEMEEESRKNMPFFLLKHYVWSDMKAMVFGAKEDDEEKDKSSFLVKRSSVRDEDDGKLPLQNRATMLRISNDIAADREATQNMLRRSSTSSPTEVKALLTRNFTVANTSGTDVANKEGNAYQVATQAARLRHLSRRGSLRDDMDYVRDAPAMNDNKADEKETARALAISKKNDDNKKAEETLRRQSSSSLTSASA